MEQEAAAVGGGVEAKAKVSTEDLLRAAAGRGRLVADGGKLLSRKQTVACAMQELARRGIVRAKPVSFREKIRAAGTPGEVDRLMTTLKGLSASKKTIRKAERDAARRKAELEG